MRKLFILSVFLPFFSIAQEYADILKVGYSYAPNVKFKNYDEQTDVNSFEANLTLPIVLNDKHALITGIDFNSSRLLLSPEYNQSTTLYNTLLKIGLATTHSEKWSTTFVLLPKIASDYKRISSDDFYFGGYATAKFKKSENLSYRFGFYTSTEAFGLFATPIFGAYYKSPNTKFEVDASLPIKADVNYSIGKTKIGFDYFGIGRSYNISQETSAPVYIEQSPLEFSTYFEYGILDNSILLRTKLGYSNNNYEVYEQGDELDFRLSAFSFGDDRAQLNPDILGSVFFKLQVVYRVYFKINN
ncbi:DUF6268 family outer membrane beta-barrel protein [Urechidicola vernalis]|uniref:DUF6268 family outer membrane beta-barrel protein n=1 Tax=Urechidicola vernalis TaxID=3075600 RepID=A0ABU2Y118_9FLAO|nr:DUF6268 family outer membrane beta-barrel protein [Urechidicola sp. P050]MDT0551873.1 DUF6268 family outer membrane beta-barrel protein [Urechidicola sp. P050]